MTNFDLYPAIDLRGGQVVRLKEGDPNRETRYSTDPAAAAARWIAEGARWLHVVNLDGAFGAETAANIAALAGILGEATAAGVAVQFGGGLRSLALLETALAMGAARVVLGTMAVEQPEQLSEALRRWGAERVAVSLDARDGRVQVRGWQTDTPHQAIDLAAHLRDSGLRWLMFTDIARDGLQTGINLAATSALARATGLSVIASGGARDIADILAARAAGLHGVITGRALYEGTLDLKAAFAALHEDTQAG